MDTGTYIQTAENFTSTTRERIVSIDMLRGLMLIIMTFDHFNGFFSKYTYETFGFVSAAAGFIFLSGYVYGLVYTRTYLRHDYKALVNKSLRRAGVIYFYYIITLFVVLIPVITHLWDYPQLDLFIRNPVRSAILFSVFLIQPENMDILPMYIIFILAGPLVIRAFYRDKVVNIMIISIMLWLVGQLGLYNALGQALDRYGLRLGHFNIFCWQLLFFAGCYLGYLKSAGKSLSVVSKRLTILSIIALVIFTTARHMNDTSYLYMILEYFADKDTLGIVRLINFAVIAYLINILVIRNERIFTSGWISFIGQHSLQVFTYSVILLYLYIPVRSVLHGYELWLKIIVEIALVVSLAVPAMLHKSAVRNIPFIKRLGL